MLLRGAVLSSHWNIFSCPVPYSRDTINGTARRMACSLLETHCKVIFSFFNHVEKLTCYCFEEQHRFVLYKKLNSCVHCQQDCRSGFGQLNTGLHVTILLSGHCKVRTEQHIGGKVSINIRVLYLRNVPVLYGLESHIKYFFLWKASSENWLYRWQAYWMSKSEFR